MLRCSIGGLLTLALWFSAERLHAGESDDQRVRLHVDALDHRIKKIAKGSYTLPKLLELQSAEVSAPGSDKNASKRISIVSKIVDPQNNAVALDGEPKPIQVLFPSTLEGFKLRSILDHVCAQVEGVTLIRDDFIEIVPQGEALTEFNLVVPMPELNPLLFANNPGWFERLQPAMPSLVHGFYEKVTVEKAFEDIAERLNQNIVIAPQARAKVQIVVSARLVNVTIETAVETLANMADLRVIQRPGVLYVTTKQQAAELNEVITREGKLNSMRRPTPQ